jgi:ribosomal protein L7/L12
VLEDPAVRAALAEGNKILAIKLVRERTGLGLKESKDLVEREPG